MSLKRQSSDVVNDVWCLHTSYIALHGCVITYKYKHCCPTIAHLLIIQKNSTQAGCSSLMGTSAGLGPLGCRDTELCNTAKSPGPSLGKVCPKVPWHHCPSSVRKTNSLLVWRCFHTIGITQSINESGRFSQTRRKD